MKTQLIDIHKMSPYETYSFTINLPNPLECECWRDLYIRYREIFKKLGRYAYLTMYPEFSTRGDKLHYHGTLRPKLYKCIYKIYKILLNLPACIEVDSIFDYKWYVYCTKGRHIFEPFFKHNMLPYIIAP